jgi:diguanylate cyclase (GGDEF)-like protein
VDRSHLPDLFSLAVIIVGFRPLARRAGPHANLWFLAWGFLLLNHAAMLFDSANPLLQTIISLTAQLSIDLCALAFLRVTANVPTKRISRMLMVELALPILLQSTLFILRPGARVAQCALCLLFFVPALHLSMKRRARTPPMILVTAAFACMGLAMAPIALSDTALAVRLSLMLLFFSAAYLFFISAARQTRGVNAATTGLIAWGLSYPFVAVLAHWKPHLSLDRALIELPQYLVVAGIMLTLLEEQLERTERMAMHDPLTDLPNRRLFEERLIATMEEARLARTTVACLVIDVDNFKTINDTLGHSAGDQLLRALAVRLSWHMSPRDILARTGGDEFTALLAGVSDEHHLRFIASAMMSAGSVPIAVDGQAVDVRISIGIALSPDHADDIDGLRRAADQAMYSAKRRGGSMLAFADED